MEALQASTCVYKTIDPRSGYIIVDNRNQTDKIIIVDDILYIYSYLILFLLIQTTIMEALRTSSCGF